MPDPLFGRGVQVRYDRTGQTYSRTRRPDPRIAAVINEALRGAATVANIGAGTGSYEPARTVISVEPSRVMIAQRPPRCAPEYRPSPSTCRFARTPWTPHWPC